MQSAMSNQDDLPQPVGCPVALAPAESVEEEKVVDEGKTTKRGLKRKGLANTLSLLGHCADYQVDNVQVLPHTEAFAVVWGKSWLVRRVEEEEPGELQQMIGKDGNYRHGLPWHGFNEICLQDFIDKDYCVKYAHVFVAPNADFRLQTCLHHVYPYNEWDLETYANAFPLNSLDIRNVSRRLLSAVDHLHSRGIIHRNIKRQCILISRDRGLRLGGLCTASLQGPSFTRPVDNYCCTTLSAQAPELLLGFQRYGPAQDVWSCAVVMLQLCKCFKRLENSCFGIESYCRDAELSHVLAIFAYLGRPSFSHPLVHLPRWNAIAGRGLPKWCTEVNGWEAAEPIIGKEGVRLLHAMTDLDAAHRPTSSEILVHRYFQHPLFGHKAVIEYGGEDDFITGFCAMGRDDWTEYKANSEIGAAPASRPHPPASSSLRLASDLNTEFKKGGAAIRTSANDVAEVEEWTPWSCTRRRAFAFYLARDLETERKERRYKFAIAAGVSKALSRAGACCPEICLHIYQFLFRPLKRPMADSLSPRAHCKNGFATELNPKMRSILIDWLNSVCWCKYKLEEPVLFFTIDITDAYLRQNPNLPRSRYQLLGVTALMVAAKALAAHPPGPEEMRHVTDNAYTVEEVKSFELELLHICGECYRGWSQLHFLWHYVSELGLSQRHLFAASALLESSALVYSLSRHTPGMLAAGACLCAIRFLEVMDGHGLGEISKASKALGRDLANLCRRDYTKVWQVGKEVCSHFESYIGQTDLVLTKRKYSQAKFLSIFKDLEKVSRSGGSTKETPK